MRVLVCLLHSKPYLFNPSQGFRPFASFLCWRRFTLTGCVDLASAVLRHPMRSHRGVQSLSVIRRVNSGFCYVVHYQTTPEPGRCFPPVLSNGLCAAAGRRSADGWGGMSRLSRDRPHTVPCVATPSSGSHCRRMADSSGKLTCSRHSKQSLNFYQTVSRLFRLPFLAQRYLPAVCHCC
jgi:hypothetical protein